MANPVSITVKPPFRAVSGKFVRANKELKKERRVALQSIGRRYIPIAQQEAPVKSGKFRKSLRFRTAMQGDNVVLTTSSLQPLGKWIIEGTKRHRIVAKRAKVLAFFWLKGPSGPGMYFYRSVNHPGTKPNPYHERAWRRVRPYSHEILRRLTRDYVVKIQ